MATDTTVDDNTVGPVIAGTQWEHRRDRREEDETTKTGRVHGQNPYPFRVLQSDRTVSSEKEDDPCAQNGGGTTIDLYQGVPSDKSLRILERSQELRRNRGPAELTRPESRGRTRTKRRRDTGGWGSGSPGKKKKGHKTDLDATTISVRTLLCGNDKHKSM